MVGQVVIEHDQFSDLDRAANAVVGDGERHEAAKLLQEAAPRRLWLDGVWLAVERPRHPKPISRYGLVHGQVSSSWGAHRVVALRSLDRGVECRGGLEIVPRGRGGTLPGRGSSA